MNEAAEERGVGSDRLPAFPFSGWSAEAIDFLAAARKAGRSLTEIARAMGLSKGAIAGKAGRLNLPAKGSLGGRPVEPTSRRSIAKAAAARLQKHSEPAPRRPQVHYGKRQPLPPSVPLTPPDAKPLNGGCRWPTWGNRERPTHVYCEAARFDVLSPYCPHHQRVAKRNARTPEEGDE